jgi:lysophospholipase L1-like esterase
MEKNPKVKTVILFLGVNDLRNSKPEILERCVTNTQWMIDKVKETYGTNTQIMVLSSPGIVAEVMAEKFRKKGYDEKEQVMLNKLRPRYRELAEKNNCLFVDLWGVVSPKYYHEGLHPELPGQAQIAEAVWNGLVNNGEPAKVACIGDSITAGSGIKNKSDKYPAQLQQLLGAPYKVTNYGISSRTLLKKGDHPYWNEAKYKKALNSNPNYVIIKLGTNDTKPQNWKYKNDFRSNLKELAQSFINLPSRPKVFLAYPIAVQHDRWGINEKDLSQGVIPIIKSVAKELNLPIINFHDALPAAPKYYLDGVHPNPQGTHILAVTAWESIKERPLPQK